jgi:mannose-6-phosphate isomerase-like protein (cupin superfamily)
VGTVDIVSRFAARALFVYATSKRSSKVVAGDAILKHIRENEVKGERFGPPHERTIKHLAAPWTMGTHNLWMGITEIDAGSSSSLHLHDDLEEIFFVIGGQGKIRVDNEEETIGPGSCIYIPIGCSHQLTNLGSETLKVVASASPPFDREKFDKVHRTRL